jgi:Predicted ATPase with chaperone activity
VYIRVSRAKGSEIFPADIILIVAMNPCPCGNTGHPEKKCICTAIEKSRYKKKISGPILDRIDLCIELSHIEYKNLHEDTKNENSETYKKKISEAREFLSNTKTKKEIKDYNLENTAKNLLQSLASKFSLSPRAYTRVIKVANTIAALEKKEIINDKHILEAFQYRIKDF